MINVPIANLRLDLFGCTTLCGFISDMGKSVINILGVGFHPESNGIWVASNCLLIFEGEAISRMTGYGSLWCLGHGIKNNITYKE